MNEINSNLPSDTIRTALDKAPAFVALMTILLIVMSVSHEYGYFWIVGRQFQTFISTTDYFTNGVLWLPAGLLFVYGNVEWWRLKDDDEPKKNWRDWKTWLWPAFVVLFYLAFFLFLEWPPGIFQCLTILSISVFVWAKVWKFIVPLNALSEPFGTILRELMRSIPPTMLGMFIWGLVNAEGDLSSNVDPYIVHFKSNSQSHELRQILRSFDRGLLLKNPTTNRVEFLKWDDIEIISRPVPDKARSMICYFFEICPRNRQGTTP